jgi:hypothetical protein
MTIERQTFGKELKAKKSISPQRSPINRQIPTLEIAEEM